MPNIGFPELLVIAMILTLVFGASRLPQLGGSMGRAIRKLKRSFDEDERIEVKRVDPEAGQPDKRKASDTSATEEPADAEILEETRAPRRD